MINKIFIIFCNTGVKLNEGEMVLIGESLEILKIQHNKQSCL